MVQTGIIGVRQNKYFMGNYATFNLVDILTALKGDDSRQIEQI